MRYLIFILIYTILAIYIFLRLKHLISSKRSQRWYKVVYLVLVVIYPLSLTYEHWNMNLLLQALSFLSDYLLPFFFYVFLFLLVFELFLIINRLFRFVSEETRRSHSFRMYALSAIILLPAIIVIAGIINLNTIRITEYQVEVPGKRSQLDHLRIAFVCDAHIQESTHMRFIEQYVRKVNALEPDILLYGGDLVEGDYRKEVTPSIQSVLGTIQTTYGAYGVPGNHEYYGGFDMHKFYRESGITLLIDTVIRIDSLIYLAGRNDQYAGARLTSQELLGSLPLDLPVILLDHRPTELQEASLTATAIQFSGHTHGGQLFPLQLITRHIYELNRGYRKIRNTHFFVSCGLRLWGPPVKTAGKSEILLVDVQFVP
jgi:predicted MPP superfamily phosphohydrolase